MTFTFSDDHEVDYPALGMCGICGKRFTQGCEHSNTQEAQEWLAAYAAVETSRANVEHYLESVEQNHPVEAAYALEQAMDDPRTEWERNWDDYCSETEETNRDLGEWARGR